MTKEYYEKLSTLFNDLNLEMELSSPVEIKHFFSGAALYVGESICASWSPVGLAFKLPEKEVNILIKEGKAKPLKYFPKGHIKKGYAVFERPDNKSSKQLKALFLKAAKSVS